ncbi:MAG: nucleotidyltransferase domain-containing protein [Bacteroidaceae bacterium]|nr:nucleotidyltransferase domain-containing protein [Bacteroidaceae bacterium]
MRRTDVVNNIQAVMHSAFPHAKVILYGSEARGDARPDSDIDLLILLDKDKVALSDEEAVTMPLYEIEVKTGVPISPLVMSKSAWENRPIKSPFYINVNNEGVVL